VTEQISYLLGLLNSKLLWWFIRRTAATKQGGFYEFKPMYVSQIPIPVDVNRKPIEKLVDKILAAKRADPSADVSAWEREIDQLVYQLYGLTKDEIEIVEESNSQ
jgi:type II restriction/modification system DNA methylase subunit YeeA